MKKVLIALLALLLLAGCERKIVYSDPGKDSTDMSGYDLDSDNFCEITLEEFFKCVEEKRTMMILISHITCPWCQCLAPVVDEEAEKFSIRVYYLDADSQYLNDEKFMAFCKQLEGKTTVDEEGNDCLWLPSILYVQKGEPFDMHIGTVSGHDATTSALSEKQRARLVYNLEKEINALLGN